MAERILAVFQDKTEAEIVKALLTSNGINAGISADNAGGFYPSLDALGGVKITVDEEDYESALSILNSRDFEAADLPE